MCVRVDYGMASETRFSTFGVSKPRRGHYARILKMIEGSPLRTLRNYSEACVCVQRSSSLARVYEEREREREVCCVCFFFLFKLCTLFPTGI